MIAAGTALAANGEPFFVHLNHYPEEGSANFIVSPCAHPEEVSECISYMLECKTARPNSLDFSVIYGPVEETARTLIEGTNGSTSGNLSFADGHMTAKLLVQSVSMTPNEMDGIWSVTVQVEFPEDVAGNLTRSAMESASIQFGKYNFPIADSIADGEKLFSFKNNCAALWASGN